jgi:hypothetical protein
MRVLAEILAARPSPSTYARWRPLAPVGAGTKETSSWTQPKVIRVRTGMLPHPNLCGTPTPTTPRLPHKIAQRCRHMGVARWIGRASKSARSLRHEVLR